MDMELVICQRLALTKHLACVLRKHDYLQKDINVSLGHIGAIESCCSEVGVRTVKPDNYCGSKVC